MSSASPSTALAIDSPTENQELSKARFQKLLQANARWKDRSENTSRDLHLSGLKKPPCQNAVSIVLLGDSMLERMKTTGKNPSLQPWPSNEMLGPGALHRMKGANPLVSRRLEGVFNAGVGGDGMQNIIYRLAGDGERQLHGLLPAFAAHNIKLFVLHCGTNNLHAKHGLRDGDVQYMRLILQSILHIARAETKVLATGLFYRNDISDLLVDQANSKIEALVESMNANISAQRFVYMPPPAMVGKQHLVDHVHLSIEGYKLWVEELFQEVARLLREVGLLRSAGWMIRENAEQEFKHSLRSSGDSTPL